MYRNSYFIYDYRYTSPDQRIVRPTVRFTIDTPLKEISPTYFNAIDTLVKTSALLVDLSGALHIQNFSRAISSHRTPLVVFGVETRNYLIN